MWKGETAMTRATNRTCESTRVVAQSAVSYYYFTKVRFAGLYFASHNAQAVRPESPLRIS